MYVGMSAERELLVAAGSVVERSSCVKWVRKLFASIALDSLRTNF